MSGSLHQTDTQAVPENESLCPADARTDDPPAQAAEPGAASEQEPEAEFPDKKLRDRNHGFSLTWVLCGACVLIFLSAMGIGNTESWEPYEKIGYYSPERIWKGAYWALLTSALVHLDFMHLAMNLYWLWWFGHAFERSFGSVRWLLFFVTSAWVSSGVQMLSGDPGIGASGVGYALLGFGWIARDHYPEFRLVMPDRIIRGFIVWFFLCVVITVAGILRIGNEAHLGGLLFGVLTARLTLTRPRPFWAPLGLAALTALSVLPLAWCPWSVTWISIQAERAHHAQRYMEAAGWYHQSLKLGQDPTWVWHSLAEIYGYLQLDAEYADALHHLRPLSPEKADQVEHDYGPPGSVK